MKSLWLLTALAALSFALAPAPLRAEKPNFSGAWSTTSPTDETGGGRGRGARAAGRGTAARGGGIRGTGGRTAGGRGGQGQGLAERGRGAQRLQTEPGSTWGEAFLLEQTDELLTMTRTYFRRNDMQRDLKLRFPLDGSTRDNEQLLGRGTQHLETSAAWDDDKLVLTTTHFYQPTGAAAPLPYKVVQTLTLEKPADDPADAPPQLVIETRSEPLPGTDGEEATSRVVFYRSGERRP